MNYFYILFNAYYYDIHVNMRRSTFTITPEEVFGNSNFFHKHQHIKLTPPFFSVLYFFFFFQTINYILPYVITAFITNKTDTYPSRFISFLP